MEDVKSYMPQSTIAQVDTKSFDQFKEDEERINQAILICSKHPEIEKSDKLPDLDAGILPSVVTILTWVNDKTNKLQNHMGFTEMFTEAVSRFADYSQVANSIVSSGTSFNKLASAEQETCLEKWTDQQAMVRLLASKTGAVNPSSIPALSKAREAATLVNSAAILGLLLRHDLETAQVKLESQIATLTRMIPVLSFKDQSNANTRLSLLQNLNQETQRALDEAMKSVKGSSHTAYLAQILHGGLPDELANKILRHEVEQSLDVETPHLRVSVGDWLNACDMLSSNFSNADGKKRPSQITQSAREKISALPTSSHRLVVNRLAHYTLTNPYILSLDPQHVKRQVLAAQETCQDILEVISSDVEKRKCRSAEPPQGIASRYFANLDRGQVDSWLKTPNGWMYAKAFRPLESLRSAWDQQIATSSERLQRVAIFKDHMSDREREVFEQFEMQCRADNASFKLATSGTTRNKVKEGLKDRLRALTMLESQYPEYENDRSFDGFRLAVGKRLQAEEEGVSAGAEDESEQGSMSDIGETRCETFSSDGMGDDPGTGGLLVDDIAKAGTSGDGVSETEPIVESKSDGAGTIAENEEEAHVVITNHFEPKNKVPWKGFQLGSIEFLPPATKDTEGVE